MEIIEMNRFGLKIAFFLLIIFALCHNNYAQNPAEQDSLTLIALYASTNGHNWFNKTGWENHDRPLDQWHGVEINIETRRVTTLSLGNNNLNGPLPDAIGNLTDDKFIGRLGDVLTDHQAEIVMADLSNVFNRSDRSRIGGFIQTLSLLPFQEDCVIKHSSITRYTPRTRLLSNLSFGLKEYKKNAVERAVNTMDKFREAKRQGWHY